MGIMSRIIYLVTKIILRIYLPNPLSLTKKIQTIFESQVRDALRDNEKIIYQATPIFRGNELMARGINLQAVSSDGSLDFNVYLFNVQPGYVFNYHNGRAKVDHQMRVNSKMGV